MSTPIQESRSPSRLVPQGLGGMVPDYECSKQDEIDLFLCSPEILVSPSSSFPFFDASVDKNDSELVDELTDWMASGDYVDELVFEELLPCKLKYSGSRDHQQVLKVPTLNESPSITVKYMVPPAPDAPAAIKRNYRKKIAIPRFLRKRATRNWKHHIIHASRRTAAMRRPRNSGKFHRGTPEFVSVSVLRKRAFSEI